MRQTLIERTESAWSSPLLIKALLQSPMTDNPDQEIVYRDKVRLTYREFRRRVNRLGNALRALGVGPGDTVAVMDYDSHRYLECFFAVPMLGAVLHTVNVRLSPEQILYTIDHAGDDVLLVHADFLPLLEQIKGRIDGVRHFVLLEDEPASPPNGLHFAGEYEALLAAQPDSCEFPDFHEDTRATTFYTTGTTGMPKGVYFSHRQLVLHTLVVMASFGSVDGHGRFHRQDVYMPITPMFHVHAWGFPYVATFLGTKQVYPGRYAPKPLLDLISREGVTFSHCVPTILHMLLSAPEAAGADLSGWKVVIGGAALPRALCQKALEKGIDLFSGYGMSETCPVLTLAHLDPEDLSLPLAKQTDVRVMTGRPLGLVDLRVVDEEMRDVPRDGKSVGEIVVRAPWLTQGYLKDPRGSETLWQGGWLHTGDVATRDERRWVRITDRTKDVIKAGGEWISSLELEDIIGRHPAVAEVAVIGLPDDRWGERPLALAVLKPGIEAAGTEKDILAKAREYADKGILPKQVVLLKVRFVEVIDKTSVGKVDKVALRKKHR